MSLSTLFIAAAAILFFLEAIGFRGGLAIWGFVCFAIGHLPLGSPIVIRK